MRLSDEQILDVWIREGSMDKFPAALIATVRRCLALAALPDEQKEYADIERRGFVSSEPGGLPK